MPNFTSLISSSSFTSTEIAKYISGGYGFSASSGKAISNGTYSILMQQAPSNVQKVAVNAKPQNGLNIICCSTSYLGDSTFSGIVFSVKVVSGKTFFRLYGTNSSLSITKEGAASLISECPMPKSMSSNTSYQFELTTGRYGWQVTYLNGAKKIPLIQLPILSETSLTTSQTKNFFRASNAVYCGVRADVAGIEINSLTISYSGTQGNPYGIETALLDCTSPPTQNPWQPSYFTNKINAVGSLTGFSTSSSTGYLTLPVTASTTTSSTLFINSLTNTNSDGVSNDDLPVVIIKFDYISGEPVISFDHGGVIKNLYFNSSIDAGVAHAVSEETGGPTF